MQCSIENHELDYGCFNKCLYNSSSNCQWKKSLKKDASTFYKTKETTENSELFDQLKNVTIGELCSVPCNDEKEVPKMICDLCKNVPDWTKDSTIGTICGNDPCSVTVPIATKFCDFCKLFSDLDEPSEKVKEYYVEMQDDGKSLGKQKFQNINFHKCF